MDINYYNYPELREKAIAYDAKQTDLENLWNWFTDYGNCYWNGECYDADGYLLYPVYAEESDEYDNFEILGYELRRC